MVALQHPFFLLAASNSRHSTYTYTTNPFSEKKSIFRFSPFVGRSARVCTLEMCLNTAQWQMCLPSEGSIERAYVPAAIHT